MLYLAENPLFMFICCLFFKQKSYFLKCCLLVQKGNYHVHGVDAHMFTLKQKCNKQMRLSKCLDLEQSQLFRICRSRINLFPRTFKSQRPQKRFQEKSKFQKDFQQWWNIAPPASGRCNWKNFCQISFKPKR